jgi:hypothetical protein
VRALAICLLWATASVASAEPVYVIEQLVVGVESAPEGTGERIASIRSGDRVEELERLGEESRIRLGNGTEGWVRSSYLSGDLPLKRQLADRTRELDSVRAELASARSEAQAARVAAASSPPSPVAADPAPEAEEAAVPARQLFPRPRETTGPSWLLVATSCLVALAAGFALGWRVLDQRIRRKYGGLRIY